MTPSTVAEANKMLSTGKVSTDRYVIVSLPYIVYIDLNLLPKIEF